MQITARIIALTFAGGALGSGLRWLIGVLVEGATVTTNEPGQYPQIDLARVITLFVVNILGAALLGWFNGSAAFSSDERKAFWSTGFAGGFTTMSGVAIWLVVTDGFTAAGAALVSGQIAIGLDAYWLALRAAKKRGRR